MAMDPDREAQIKTQIEAQSGAKSGVEVGTLIFDEAPTKVPAEYSNYSNVFSSKNAAELPENTRMNQNAIELEEGKQSPFESIYSLGPVELEMLKTYIKTNLANSFIWPSKSPVRHLSCLIKS